MNQDLPFDVSIHFNATVNQIHIGSDTGCLLRPIINANKVHLLDTYINNSLHHCWNLLLTNGVIFYCDSEESNTYIIATDLTMYHENPTKYTHIEVDSSSILGLCSSIIPFLEHNQAPRDIYQSSMCKQHVSLSATNFQNRFDTIGYTMNYPQRPLVTTSHYEILHFNETPSVVNLVVLISPYNGFNMEDSIVMSRSAIDFGLFNSSITHTYKDSIKNKNASTITNAKNLPTKHGDFFGNPNDI